MKIFKSAKMLFASLVLVFGVSALSAAAPVITSTAVTAATEDVAYSYALSASDVDGDALTWSAPTLPSWLSLSSIDGVVTTLAGSTSGYLDGTGTATQFKAPTGVAVDSSGNVYVADKANHRIRKITADGVVTTLAGSGTAAYVDGTGTEASFSSPSGVTVDSSGNVYVADTSNHSIRKITAEGVVTTLAGSGTDYYLDGTGTAASFGRPEGLTVDSNGNIYVADTGNSRIRKITADGVVTTLAGGTASSGDGTFNTPYGVTVDSSGNIYVADTYNNRIRKITADGVITTIAVDFSNPRGVTVDSSGNVYVADTFNNRIRKITADGVVTTLAGSGTGTYADGTGTAASFSEPAGVTVDSSGNVYVADTINNRIRKVTTVNISGTPTNSDVGIHDVSLDVSDGTTTTTQTFQITVANVNDVPVITSTAITTVNEDSSYSYTLTGTDADGDTLTWNATSGTTLPSWLSLSTTSIIDTVAGILGTSGTSGDDGYATSAGLKNPKGIAVDSDGHIYIADTSNHAIRKVDAITGIITTVAGTLGTSGATGDGGAATSATLDTPYNVTVDSNGNLYIVDTYNHAIRKVDAATGTITTVAGTLGTLGDTGDGGLATSARLNYPYGVAVDSNGHIYIADTANHAIRKVDATTGVITTVAGTIKISGSTGDGGSATSATLNLPYDITVDSSENIYIADTANYALRKVDATTGVITTVAGIFGTSGATGDNGNATAATLNSSFGVTVDSSGNIYIADAYNHAIRKIDTNGIITTVAGTLESAGATGDGEAATLATLNTPYNVTVDSSGNIYIADESNNAIRKVTMSTKLVGTPTNADVDVYNINLTVIDGNGGTDTQNFTITVNPLAPTVTSTSITSVDEDSPYSYTLTGSDAQGDTLTWSPTSGTTLPSWLSLNNDGVVKTLTGTPTNTDVGVHDVNLTLSDGTNDVTYNFQITVVNVDDTPTLDALADVDALEDANIFSLTLNATDADGDSITYTATSSNTDIATVAIIDGKLVVTQVADANGDVSIEVTATANGASVTQSFDFSVTSVNDAPVFGVVSDKIVYKNSGTHTISLPISDIDSSVFTYSYSYNTALLSSVTTDAKIMSVVVIPDVSGSTDINVTVSDGDINVSKVFNFSILPLTVGEDAQEVGNIDINETSTSKTITLTIESNLTLQTQENVDGSVGHSIQVADKKITATSDINGSTVTFNEKGISTKYSDTNLSLEVNATLTGEATHTLTVGDITTTTRSEFVGANTNVTTAENGSIEITTSVTVDANTTVSAVAYADGTAKHTLSVDGKISQVTSSVKGANTLIKTTGDVETTAGSIADGSGYEIKAIATTLVNGKTTTGFVKVSTTDATDSTLSNTLSSDSAFSVGSKIRILELDSVLFIETITTLDENLVIE